MNRIVYDHQLKCLVEVNVEVKSMAYTVQYFNERVQALEYLGKKLTQLENNRKNLTTLEYTSFLDDLSINIAWENSQLESAYQSIKSKLPLSHLRIESIQ